MIVTQLEPGERRTAADTIPRSTATVPLATAHSTTTNGINGLVSRPDAIERCAWSVVWLGVLSGGGALWGSWSSWVLGGVVAPLVVLAGILGLATTWVVTTPRSGLFQLSALGGALVSTAAGQAVAIHVRQFYNTDAAAFDQVAARVLVHGSDPYTASLSSAASRLLHVPADFWTYTLTGSFVDHVSYPAGSFLLEAPALLLGFDHEVVDWIDLYAWIVTAVLVFVLLPRALRWLSALLLMTPVFVGTFGSGGTDAATLPFLVLAVWQWDRFGRGKEAGVARWLGPVALGVACSIKQTPWFCVPFLLVGLFLEARNEGRPAWRLVLRYLAVVGSVFAVINLPFVVWQPAAWARGTFLPFISSLVPDGQGLVTVVLHGIARGVSLPLLTAAGVLVLLALLAAFVAWYPVMKRVWLFLLPLTFFVATRSLSTYLLDLVPAALVAAVSVATPVAKRKRQEADGRRRLFAVASLGLTAAVVGVVTLAFTSVPLQIGVRKVETSYNPAFSALKMNSVTLTVRNDTSRTVVPHFMVDVAETNPQGFWTTARHQPVVIAPRGTVTVTLFPPDYTWAPAHGSEWLVEAFTSSPQALSTSGLQFWTRGPVS